MIEYRVTAAAISAGHLGGFFEDWPSPPSASTHLELLRGSDEVVLALDSDTGAVVGFVTAVTDRVLSAYIPLIEVRADFRRRGIGGELMRRMLARLGGLYMIDVMCDTAMLPFYERLGFTRASGASLRRLEHQSGIV